MNIVLDNIIYSNVAQGGVSNYWYEWTKFLLKEESDNLLFYEEKHSCFNFHRNQLQIPENKISYNQSSSNSSIRRRLSTVKIKKKEFFLYHSSYYRPVSINNDFKEITTVHDFTHDYYSNFIKKHVHNHLKYSCIKRSNGIVCISDNTYKDLIQFCPPNKNQKVIIIPNGVSDDFFIIQDRSNFPLMHLEFILNKPYILFVGSRINYKNFNFVINLIKEISNINLIVVGENLSKIELKLFDKDSLSRTSIITNIKNSELNILYNFAHAFIYPSSYEGFGIPIIEAMKAGCPVLALNKSSISEVSGNAAILFDELDIGDFKKAINNLYSLEYRCDIISKGLLQSTKYSWEKCHKNTYEFYKEIY